MIIVTILGIILLAICIALFVTDNKGLATVAGIIGLIALLIGGCFDYVPTGYVGVKTTFGQISETPYTSGRLYIHLPFAENINNVNCKQQEKAFEGKVWSETSERTEIYVENPVIDYQIVANEATWIWQNVEEYDNQLVKRTSVESGIKAATKQYNDTDVTDRSKIERTAKDFIQKTLDEKYGRHVVDIVAVTFPNMNFSDAYNKAIEERAQKKLAAETAEYENQKIINQKKAEAEQRKIEAESKSEAKRIEAEANAQVKLTEAEAQAKANKMISDSITDKVLMSKYLDNMRAETDKWDGKRSMISDSNGTYIYDMKDIKDMFNGQE